MEDKKFLKLNDVDAFKIAFHLSNYVWEIVIKWDYFPKTTIGGQFVNAVDSLSANIAEGFGRYGKKDKIRFYRIGMGSVLECLDWNQKSKIRKLHSVEQYDHIYDELKKLPKSINALIKITNEKLTI
jgi:four helix bundle protein